ncbi:MAG: ester cyclase [Oceanicaulis sp.]
MSRRDFTAGAAGAAGLAGGFSSMASARDALNPGVDLHAIARDHIEGIWARGDEALAYQMYAPDVVDHNPAPDQRPRIAGIVDVLRWLRESVPDLSMRINAYVVDANHAADRWTMTGTHTGAPLMGVEARGKAFSINGMDVIKVRPDGLITDVWHVEEFALLLDQIQAE